MGQGTALGQSQAAQASLTPRLGSHDARLSKAAASRLDQHDRLFARLALPQPFKATSGYGRPVSRADFTFWPRFGRGTDAGRDPKGH